MLGRLVAVEETDGGRSWCDDEQVLQPVHWLPSDPTRERLQRWFHHSQRITRFNSAGCLPNTKVDSFISSLVIRPRIRHRCSAKEFVHCCAWVDISAAAANHCDDHYRKDAGQCAKTDVWWISIITCKSFRIYQCVIGSNLCFANSKAIIILSSTNFQSLTVCQERRAGRRAKHKWWCSLWWMGVKGSSWPHVTVLPLHSHY